MKPYRLSQRVGRERGHQADVRTLRRLDRTHATVVTWVHVPDLEPRALARQATRPKGREPPAVRKTGQRVGLVHELAELARPEELFDRGDDRADVDQGLRRDRLDVLGCHALLDDALHPGQPHSDLVLQELAHRTHPAVAEVIDVIGLVVGVAGMEPDEVADRLEDVLLTENGPHLLDRLLVVLEPKLLVGLVAADLSQVVALAVEEQVVEKVPRALDGGRLARPQLAVDVHESFFLGLDGILLESQSDRLGAVEEIENLLIAAEAEGLQEDRDVLATLPVHAHADRVALIGLELEPSSAGRDHLAGEDVFVRGLVHIAIEVDARRPDELRYDDTLGAVDDEGSLVGHHREVPHEDRLLLDLAGLLVDEGSGHEQRTGIVEVFLLALVLVELRSLELVRDELQREVPGEVLDRRDIRQGLVQALIEEPEKRLSLYGYEVRRGKGFLELCEGTAVAQGVRRQAILLGLLQDGDPIRTREGGRRTPSRGRPQPEPPGRFLAARQVVSNGRG